MRKNTQIATVLITTVIMAVTQQSVAEDLHNIPDWQQPTGKQNIMTVYAEAIKDGANLGNNDLSMLSAWDGEEIIGVTCSYTNPYNGYPTFFITLASNSSSINCMTFKIYDADSDSIYNIDTTVDFVADDELGDFYEPVLLFVGSPTPDWQQPLGKQNTFTITTAVMLGDYPLGSNPESMLSAWDGEEITGMAQSYINPITGYPTFALIAVSDKYSITNMTLKLYDADTQKIYEVEESLNFVADSEAGSFLEPLILNAVGPLSGNELEITGDFDLNGQVDEADLIIFCTQWMTDSSLEADIFPMGNGDGRVDFADFAVFADAWLTETP